MVSVDAITGYARIQAQEGARHKAFELAMQEIHEKAEEVGREMGFSPEYAALLCKGLWKQNYVRGTVVTGYELTEKGEKFLLETEKSGK